MVDVKQKLNSVSSSFCAAKWTTVTLHLENGTTHSCHHPPVHPIPVEEIKKNPAALHNTKFKINERKEMFRGERPAGCDYCWKIEDLEAFEVSDRVIKSGEEYSFSEIDKIIKNPFTEKFQPKYVEVSFSSNCQFKCSYCSADYSSSWQEEIEKLGPYRIEKKPAANKNFNEDENPYINSFWQWWPEIKNNLHTFRITGGEPMLSPNTFKILEDLKNSPLPNLNFIINSNLGAPEVLFNKFNKAVQDLYNSKAVADFQVYASLDAYGTQAEYIRHGLRHDYFWTNIEKLLQGNESLKILIMCTFNALSVDSYIDFLKKILEINRKYKNSKRPLALVLDIAYLRYPDYQSVKVLPVEYLDKMLNIKKFIEDNMWNKASDKSGFDDYQLVKFNRIIEWMKTPQEKNEQERLKKRFFTFFSEHDRRRSTNFLKIFPDLESFWKDCAKLANEEY